MSLSFCDRVKQFFRDLTVNESCISSCCNTTIEKKGHHHHHHKHHHKHKDKDKDEVELKTETENKK
jgi:hypothetical protein